MNKNKIRGLLIEREGSIDAVAKRIRSPRSQVSATINYLRLNLAIRKKLIQVYGIKFSPHIKPAYSWRKPRRAKTQEVSR